LKHTRHFRLVRSTHLCIWASVPDVP
jgi:hypothetical protein